jgi:hypothetical protein
MGLDGDKMFLTWLMHQPSGKANINELEDHVGAVNLSWMVQTGLIVPITYEAEPGVVHGYVITQAGKQFQDGD